MRSLCLGPSNAPLSGPPEASSYRPSAGGPRGRTGTGGAPEPKPRPHSSPAPRASYRHRRPATGRARALLASALAIPLSAWSDLGHAEPALSTPSPRALRALESIRAWRIEDARPEVETLLEERPDDPYTLALVAQLKFHLGDYAGATRFFESARKAGAPPQFLYDAGAAEKARLATEGYEEHVGKNFVIRYPPGKDALLVPFAEEALEAARERIGRLLGWTPQERVLVEIYPTAKTLASVSALTPKDIETSGTIALCKWNRLMATTPRAVVFGYAWRDTLAHELTHLIIGGASRDTVPIWLHEGLAKYAETAWRGKAGEGISPEQERALRTAARERKLIPFEAMHPSMAKLPSQEAASLAFTEVFTFIEYLVGIKGWPGIRAVLREMASGRSDTEAIEFVYEAPFNEMERRWKKSLVARTVAGNRRSRPVKGQRRLVIKNNAETPDDELHGLSRVARRYARAADLLYARGRYIAAQRELEKAFDESSSPLVSAKLAALALANNDLERAEAAARRSIESMPDLAGPNVTLAELLLKRDKREQMHLPLARALDINPFDPRIHQLMLAMLEGEDEPEQVERARRALALSGAEARPPQPLDLGRGARVRIDGSPFVRIYLQRDGRRYATQQVTPTGPIELRPGLWTLELYPPQGPVQRKDVRIPSSDRVQVIQIDTNSPQTRSSQ